MESIWRYIRRLRKFNFRNSNWADCILHKQTLANRRYLAAVFWQLMYRYGEVGAGACLRWNIQSAQ